MTLADNFRSSIGRSVAELIPGRKRLAKSMIASGHQAWERRDLVAKTLDDPDAEAVWMCDRSGSYAGRTP